MCYNVLLQNCDCDAYYGVVSADAAHQLTNPYWY